MYLKEHLLRRSTVEGEYWADTNPIGKGKFSKGLWVKSSSDWKEVITSKGEVTEYGRKKIQFYKPKLKSGDLLYRVVNRNQLYMDEGCGKIIQLPPSVCTKLRFREIEKALYDGMAKALCKNMRFSDPQQLDDYLKRVGDLEADPSTFFERNMVIYKGKRYTFLEIEIAIALSKQFDELSLGIQALFPKIEPLHRQLIYIYNTYLGSRDKPFLNFGDPNVIMLPPQTLNFCCDIRFFTPAEYLQSCLNYILHPPVYQGQNIYRQGVNGLDPETRAREYVILEFPYSEELAKLGIQETTDYEQLHGLLSDILGRINELDPLIDRIEVSKNYNPRRKYHRFILEALKVWSNIFAEVRMRGSIVPSKIYSIDAHWVKDCAIAGKGRICQVCTTFKKGEVLWKCDDPSSIGTILAMGLGPLATPSSIDLLLGLVNP
jgi:hypothetical protein